MFPLCSHIPVQSMGGLDGGLAPGGAIEFPNGATAIGRAQAMA
jgi:hypothetical protein